jgi:competence protein ComFC
MFETLEKFVLDTLFPVKCIGCGQEDHWICESCLAKIPLKSEQVCPHCEKNITPDGRVCFSCRRKTSLDGLLVAASYKNKLISSAVHCYKYRFVENLSFPLGEILTKSILNHNPPLPDLIVPVPLHKRRLRSRGFNQSEHLARYLSQNLAPGFEIPLASNILIRARYTHPQMKLKDYSQRKKNIQNAFSLNNELPDKNILKNKTVLLVDDIATTGSTLFECARVLKQNGVNEVFAVVVARQEMEK